MINRKTFQLLAQHCVLDVALAPCRGVKVAAIAFNSSYWDISHPENKGFWVCTCTIWSKIKCVTFPLNWAGSWSPSKVKSVEAQQYRSKDSSLRVECRVYRSTQEEEEMKEVLTPKKNNERRSLRKSARQVKMTTALLLIMSRGWNCF